MKQLPCAVFGAVPLREVRPSGWIRTYLERQCSGLTGHPAASGYPYGEKFWGNAGGSTRHAYAAWWPYEQNGYWIDGALKCGYLVNAAGGPGRALYEAALEGLDFAVDHAAPDGFIGPDSMREKDRWPYAVFFRAVLAQYGISGDPRYLDALVRHYHSTPHPMGWDRDVSGVEILVNLYQETGQPELLEMAEDLYARFNAKFPEHDCALETLRSAKRSTEHGVTFNELAKLSALMYSATGKPEYLAAARNGYAKIDRDQLLADGLHSCSEHLRGKDPLDSHEYCDVTDYTWALGYLFQATGEAAYADRIEQVLFNAAPGGVTKDFKALQYFSCLNQVLATDTSNHNNFLRGFNWMQYRADHEVQCCPGNMHRAMPNYVARSWLRGQNGEVVAALYGPGELRTTTPDGTPLHLHAETRYPFEEQVTLTVEPAQPARFALLLRIPSWCDSPALHVNGQPEKIALTPGSFARLERVWQPGDRVELSLPFRLRLERRPGGGVSVAYGPLTLSLPIAHRAEPEPENSTICQRREIQGSLYTEREAPHVPGYQAFNLYPTSRWNYALCVDEATLEREAEVRWNNTAGEAGFPFDLENPPLTVRLPARVVEGWEMVRTDAITQYGNFVQPDKEKGQIWKSGERTLHGDYTFTPPLPDPETLPARLGSEVEQITLVPYGATLLRITIFPAA